METKSNRLHKLVKLFWSLALGVILNISVADAAFTWIWPPTNPSFVTVGENQPVGTIVTTLRANLDFPADSVSCSLAGSPADCTDNFALSTIVGRPSDCLLLLRTVLDYDPPLNQRAFTCSAIVSLASGAGTPLNVELRISVLNVFDVAPVFTGSPYDCNVNEELPAGTALSGCSPAFTDVESGYGDVITCALRGAYARFFSCEASTCRLTTTSKFDREFTSTTDLYPTPVMTDLQFVITDSGGNTALAAVTVTLNDINDWTPQCVPALRTATVDESFIGTLVPALGCTDKDSGNNALLVYSIVSGTSVNVDSNTGQLSNTAALDYDLAPGVSPNKQVLIRVRDSATPDASQLSTTVTVTVTVTPLNDNPPVWGTFVPPYTDAVTSIATINETAGVGTMVFVAQATDADVGPDGALTYEMTSATVVGGVADLRAAFAINSVSGQLTVSAAGIVDREAGHSAVDFLIGCTDAGRPTPSAISRTVRVSVADVNEFAPTFTPANGIYSASLDERTTTAAGISVKEVVTADRDVSDTPIVCVIAGGNSLNLFRVNAANKKLLETNLAIEPDQPTANPLSYLISLACADQSGSGLTSTATVSVDIVPYNEHDPTISSPAGATLVLPEDQPLGQVAVLTPGDLDCCIDGQFDCSVSPGGTFAVSGNCDKLMLVKSMDRETQSSYSLTVSIVDRGSPRRIGTYSMTVTVTDVNDNVPICTPKTHSASISEIVTGASSPVTIATLSCSDADTFGIYYAMSSTAVPFAVDPGSGVVSLTGPVDFDSAVQSYSLRINAVDKNDSTKFDVATVSVTLLPVNEFTPTFPAASTLSVTETVSSGQLVASLVATDNDYSPHNVKSYRIASGDGSSYFSVATNGDIYVASGKTLDFETVPSALNPWRLVVEAADGGTPALTGTGTLTVSLVDANDNVPICTKGVFDAAIDENAASGSAVTTVVATDADSSLNNYNKVAYAKLTGDASDFFAVDGSTGAVTRTANALSYDTTKSVVFHVKATDGAGAGPNSATCTVAVVIRDVNLFAPTCTASTRTIPNVREDTALGTALFTIDTATPTFCSDGDRSQSLRYAMSPTAGSTKFAIHPTTGGIFVTEKLDYESATSIQFEVIVADNATAPRSTTVTFTVSLTDVNEFAPNCSVPASVGLNESTAVSGTVFAIACTDGDRTSTAFTYSVTTGTPFVIDAAGVLSQTAALDYESGTTSYTLRIQVADNAPSLPALMTSTYTTTISVYPINEFPPVMALPSVLYASVSEAASPGTALSLTTAALGAGSASAIAASDADRGANHGEVAYRISAGNDRGWFAIDSRTGILTVASPLDRETQSSVTLTIQAADGPGLVSAGSTQVAITLIDVNDNPPVFPTSQFTIDIYEGVASPAALITFSVPTVVSDADAGLNAYVNVSIASGVSVFPLNEFSISVYTLQTNRVFDRTTGPAQYVIVIKAQDYGLPSLSGSATVTVNILEANKAAPKFPVAGLTISVPEDTAIGSLLYYANATDTDFAGQRHRSRVPPERT